MIHYEDTGGDGPTIVFLHGLIMDSTLWRKVDRRSKATSGA
jgi:pimeloyl-ACP methyl ester carboxylesterase